MYPFTLASSINMCIVQCVGFLKHNIKETNPVPSMFFFKNSQDKSHCSK